MKLPIALALSFFAAHASAQAPGPNVDGISKARKSQGQKSQKLDGLNKDRQVKGTQKVDGISKARKAPAHKGADRLGDIKAGQGMK